METNKKISKILIIVALFLITLASLVVLFWPKKEAKNSSLNNTTPANPVVDPSTKDLTISFLQMENNKTNMIYSPLSIKYALSMVSSGAAGNTKNQIDALLPNTELTKYTYVMDKLSLANSLFIRNDFKNSVKETYVNTLKSKYNAEVIYDSFANADNMNSWIDNKTFGLIKNAIPGISKDNMIVLINALAINARWKNEFNENDTFGAAFYLENGEEIEATTMHSKQKSDSYSYYKDDEITAFSGDLEQLGTTNLEYLAIMPSDLNSYISNVTENDINNIASKLIKSSSAKNGIYLSVPKYKYDYSLQFVEDLQKLGISDLFNENLADFSNISDEELFISNAIHKANIEFSEEGIKAAAVTVFSFATSALEPEEDKPINITINKPFMYVIRDKDTKEIWFVGTVYTPNNWKDDEANYNS